MHATPDPRRTNEMVLVVDDEPGTRAGVAVAVGATGRRVVTCGDIESAQMVMERLPVRSVVTDMRLTGPFSDDGLRFIEFVLQHAPQSRVVLMTGSLSPELRREAHLRGAVAVLEKPFTTAQIDEVLTGDDTGGSTLPDIIDVPRIEDILSGTRLYSVFQPIVSIDSVEPLTFGYEALARVDTPGPMHAPEFLFEYSSRKRCMTDLELLCMDNSVRDGASLPPATSIFINLHPVALADRRIVDGLNAATTKHGLEPERVVLEITEQAAMRELPQTLENIDTLAAAGFRFAFDDVGIAYSHLLHLERVGPAFMKISQEFADFHRSSFKAKIVRNVVALAQDFGCDVVLEGVEDPRVVDAARDMGIRYVQGFLYGRPQRAGVWAL